MATNSGSDLQGHSRSLSIRQIAWDFILIFHSVSLPCILCNSLLVFISSKHRRHLLYLESHFYIMLFRRHVVYCPWSVHRCGRLLQMLRHVAWFLCVCLSVCLHVFLCVDKLCKNGWTDRDAVWGMDWLMWVQGTFIRWGQNRANPFSAA